MHGLCKHSVSYGLIVVNINLQMASFKKTNVFEPLLALPCLYTLLIKY